MTIKRSFLSTLAIALFGIILSTKYSARANLPLPQPTFDSEIANWSDSDTVIVSDEFKANIKLTAKADGGRKIPFYGSFEVDFVIGESKSKGRIRLPKGVNIFRAGDTGVVAVRLRKKIKIKKGISFEIQELGKKIGTGLILKTYK
ncbi:hypothetical protein BFP97_14520 [Roseivirga sp. 4D4]|uniref:EF-Tu C-terminal domain-related protein n=1 Tax=Roseivirga sp. 4D4 TaxID=1889784 RepID=UPI0008530CB2|nr:hypothetical protein [Roseivirga sp. 4D4]OEK02661.1 hypothetical protein BFP97_14520 [Roseivirga sp. 4D4]